MKTTTTWAALICLGAAGAASSETLEYSFGGLSFSSATDRSQNAITAYGGIEGSRNEFRYGINGFTQQIRDPDTTSYTFGAIWLGYEVFSNTVVAGFAQGLASGGEGADSIGILAEYNTGAYTLGAAVQKNSWSDDEQYTVYGGVNVLNGAEAFAQHTRTLGGEYSTAVGVQIDLAIANLDAQAALHHDNTQDYQIGGYVNVGQLAGYGVNARIGADYVASIDQNDYVTQGYEFSVGYGVTDELWIDVGYGEIDDVPTASISIEYENGDRLLDFFR